jgi:hypothetical protein
MLVGGGTLSTIAQLDIPVMFTATAVTGRSADVCRPLVPPRSQLCAKVASPAPI